MNSCTHLIRQAPMSPVGRTTTASTITLAHATASVRGIIFLRGTCSRQDSPSGRWQTELISIQRCRHRNRLPAVELAWVTFRQLKFRTTDGFGAMHIEYSVVGPLNEIDEKRYYVGPLRTFKIFCILITYFSFHQRIIESVSTASIIIIKTYLCRKQAYLSTPMYLIIHSITILQHSF